MKTLKLGNSLENKEGKGMRPWIECGQNNLPELATPEWRPQACGASHSEIENESTKLRKSLQATLSSTRDHKDIGNVLNSLFPQEV